MDKLCNFDIAINTCLADIAPQATTSNFNKNDFLLSVINGFEDGKWRDKTFHQFMMDNISQTGLSAKERDDLYDSDRCWTSITESLKNLRLVDKDKDNGRGSEIAEIVLYGIMRHHYHALPVVPKIFYKQNPNDTVKGADSVHIVIENKNEFSLWLGEAKFYNEISDARLHDPINSVFDTIDSEKIKKENSIITDLSDIEHLIKEADLRHKILNMLHRDTPIDEIKKRLHVPILLLHECEKTQKATKLTDEYINEIKTHHIERAVRYFTLQNSKQIQNGKKQEGTKPPGYEQIQFHLILFPVPNKANIVNWFISQATQLRENA